MKGVESALVAFCSYSVLKEQSLCPNFIFKNYFNAGKSRKESQHKQNRRQTSLAVEAATVARAEFKLKLA